MITQRTLNLLRALFVIFTCFVGFSVGPDIISSPWLGAAAGTCFGLTVVLADRLLKGFSLRTFSSATFGLLLGLFFSWLLLASDVLRNANEDIQWIVGLLVYCTFGYLGMMMAVRSGRDEFSLIIPYVRFRQSSVQDLPLIVDTNILIDGRLERLRDTGFIGCSLVIPRFVLDELQLLADSSDAMRRDRGRRGLTLLEQLRERDPARRDRSRDYPGAGDEDRRAPRAARAIDGRAPPDQRLKPLQDRAPAECDRAQSERTRRSASAATGRRR